MPGKQNELTENCHVILHRSARKSVTIEIVNLRMSEWIVNQNELMNVRNAALRDPTREVTVIENLNAKTTAVIANENEPRRSGSENPIVHPHLDDQVNYDLNENCSMTFETGPGNSLPIAMSCHLNRWNLRHANWGVCCAVFHQK